MRVTVGCESVQDCGVRVGSTVGVRVVRTVRVRVGSTVG